MRIYMLKIILDTKTLIRRVPNNGISILMDGLMHLKSPKPTIYKNKPENL